MLRLMDMRSVLLASAFVVALTGCTDSADKPASPDMAPLVAEAVGSRFQQDAVIPENGTAPQEFLDRDRLPSCGSFAWTLNDEAPPEGVWDCLAESFATGEPAEVIVQSPDIDSINIAYYRVTEKDRPIEVWHRDTMGDVWWRGECDSLDRDDGPIGCKATTTFD
jgi:hypothetical protein